MKNSRHAVYSLWGALNPITLNQNSCSTASDLASAAGHRHSFRKVVRKRSWKVRRGCPQEPATLLAKPDSATRQITMLTELGEPFCSVCSSPNRFQVPSSSSRSSAGTNLCRSNGAPGAARRVDNSRETAAQPLNCAFCALLCVIDKVERISVIAAATPAERKHSLPILTCGS